MFNWNISGRQLVRRLPVEMRGMNMQICDKKFKKYIEAE